TYEYHLEFDQVSKSDLEEVISDKSVFETFKNDYLVTMDSYNSIKFEHIHEPILFGEAEVKGVERIQHYLPIKEIKSPDNLIAFINDVLKDIGEVTHSTGVQNQYRVTGIIKQDHLM
ncbi:hypothetical protein D7X33_40395, partial [Butyricicoccus sp. 1XD8-22]